MLSDLLTKLLGHIFNCFSLTQVLFVCLLALLIITFNIWWYLVWKCWSPFSSMFWTTNLNMCMYVCLMSIKKESLILTEDWNTVQVYWNLKYFTSHRTMEVLVQQMSSVLSWEDQSLLRLLLKARHFSVWKDMSKSYILGLVQANYQILDLNEGIEMSRLMTLYFYHRYFMTGRLHYLC